MKSLNFSHLNILALAGVLMLSGCVSQNKHLRLQQEKDGIATQLLECDDDLLVTRSRNEQLAKQVKNLSEDSTRIGRESRDARGQLAALQTKYDKIEVYYNNLLANSGKLSGEVQGQRDRLLATEENLSLAKQRNEELNANLIEREKKVKELEKILEDKEKAVSNLKNKVSQALLNFKDSELTIEVKNGKVYVSLAEQLLFGSGSTVVDKKGITALEQLAKVLKDNSDTNILVEGHTDNVPISKNNQYMNDNWDLSVLRATSIVKILVKAGVQPATITAAGKGEHVPLTANDSAAGKQKNRRTEIILTPKLDELFMLLESN
ncbi:MAG: OmpA family protein [Bacteroidota bacterium]|nr:OmpA family protein [Bacteroidota bacterium]